MRNATAKAKKEKRRWVISNIGYALRNQWSWARERVVFLMLKIPLTVALSLLGAYFPALILSKLEQGADFVTMLRVLILYFLLWCGLDILESYRYSRVERHRYQILNTYQLLLNKKHLQTDYINTEDPHILQKYAIAWNDTMGGCACDTIVPDMLDFFVNCAGALTYGTIILTFSPLVLITILFSALITYGYGRYKIYYTESRRKVRNTFDRKMGYLIGVERNVEYAKDIRVFNMAGWLDRLYHQQMRASMAEHNKSCTVDWVGGVTSAALVLLQNGVAYTLLIRQLLTGGLHVADFVFMISVITGFSGWFTGIISGWNHIAAQSVTVGHYRAYFEVEERMNHGVGHPLPCKSDGPPAIAFEHVRFTYPTAEKPLFDDVNLQIAPGEKVAIVGANGAGKTTLIKLLCGMYLPDEGNVYVNGVPSKAYNIEEYYTLFSTVFQDMYLLPVTIREFLTTTETGEVDDQKVWWALDKMGLGDLVRAYPDGLDTRLMRGTYDGAVDLSGGERQKLMIARALYKDAPVVILDEPTAALDPIAEGRLYEQFDELTTGKTAIYISHRLSSTRFCDRIFFVKDGQITECGSHDELIATGGDYAHMFEVQSRYYQTDERGADTL